MTKVARHLITTADQRTWKFDRPVLFLGEWCRLYDKRAVWGEMDAEVLSHHWMDNDKLHADYLYLSGLYERFLVVLGERLNRIHGVNKDLRYWRILIGPWLAYFIQILFDRWSSISLAVSRFELSGSTVMVFEGNSMVPNDMGNFVELMQSDEWNHYIYSCILEQYPNVFCSKELFDHSNIKVVGKVGFKQKILNFYSKCTRHLVKDSDAFLISTYLPIIEVVRLQLRLGQLPQIWRSVDPICTKVDSGRRDWKLSVSECSKFEEFALGMIPKQIPATYLEGYSQLINQFDNLPWPKKPKVIFTSNVLWHDTVSMAYVAEKVTEGSLLVYGQHGGLYGVSKFSWAEEHEIAISDRFLTWGWSDESCQKIKAIGMLNMQKIRTCSSNEKKILLFVSLTGSKLTYRLSSDTMVMSKIFINNGLVFAGNLVNQIKSNLLVRLHKRDNGWSQAAQWKNRFPNIELDLGLYKMKNLLQETRLAVYTYNATGYLEAFAANIPAVLFWDPKVSTLRHSAIPYFEDLKSVGVFHETPESAAAHVNAVWDDVDAWWTSPAVQEVLERFKARYCHQPVDLLGRVEAALTRVMADGK